MRYVLKIYDYYLADFKYNHELRNLETITIDKEIKKIYYDFDEAEEDRKLIFIETGLNMEIKRYEREDK